MENTTTAGAVEQLAMARKQSAPQFRVFSKRRGEKPVEMETFIRITADSDGNWFTTGI